MTEKQPNNKQSRHQSAKQKYQHYHRVLSCKNLIKNVTTIAPSPGQFVVQNTTNINSSTHLNHNKSANKSTGLPKLTEPKPYSLLLTKNIKNIVQKSHPVLFGQVINQVLNKNSLQKTSSGFRVHKKNQNEHIKTEKSQEQIYFKRPISAKIYKQIEGKQIQQSQILKTAYQEDIKFRKKQETMHKNYFQVKSKLKIPKHIHGYNTIVLGDKNQGRYPNKQQQQNLTDFQDKFNIKNDTIIQSFQKEREKSFLPTQYYLNETLKPQQLLQKFKNEMGIIFGFSRWFHTDGSHSWKRCRVLKYLNTQQRWQIQWLCSGTVKKVSRNNLYFQKQNFNEFEQMVQMAESFKKKSEIYMKYNILINLIKTPTHQLSIQSENRINSLINVQICDKKQKNQYCQYKNSLLDDVKKLYQRACHQFQFNSMLPYSAVCKKMFQDVLPEQMFDLNPRKLMLNQTDKIKKIHRPECNQLFTSGLKKLKQKSFLNSEKKIKILELINMTNQQLSDMDLLKTYRRFEQKPGNNNYPSLFCKNTMTIGQLDTIMNKNINQYFYKINCRICDIQHHVSKQLDPLYSNKKSVSQELYNSTISRYHKFLFLVNMKIQSCLRQATTQVINKLISNFPTFKNCVKTSVQSQEINWDVIYLEQKINLKIELNPSIRQSRLQIDPGQTQLKQVIMRNIQKIFEQLKNIKCVSKSYLPEVRKDNLLQVIKINSQKQMQCQQTQKLSQTACRLREKLDIIELNLLNYKKCLSSNIQEIYKNNVEIHKKFQKKNSYGEIQQIIEKINNTQKQINKLIKVKQFKLCGIFETNFQEIKLKTQSKITETMKQVVNILIDKIHKDNQKIDKNVSIILQTVQKIPTNISQYVALQKFINQQLKQEIERTYHKVKMLTQKMNLLEKTSQVMEYRQFQSCCQIYLKPLTLKRARQDTLYKLQNVYKKTFAEELMKDSYLVLDSIRSCEKLLVQVLNHKTLQDMNKNFTVFNQLHEELQSLSQKMMVINQKQSLLKWSKTNFDRLIELKQEFEPYYKLITLHKNFRLNLLPLMDQSFNQINYQLVCNNVSSSFDTLKFLLNNRFAGNTIYEPIVDSIMTQYQQFNVSLPMIKSLRNPDLRQRHWLIIQQFLELKNIHTQQITFRQILTKPKIKSEQHQLHKISQMATKQLIYQKSLNQLKREWKQVRIVTRQLKIGSEVFKFINNLAQIQKKLQSDMLQINNILSSSFIKFLEGDIMNWKTIVLQKVYQFINYWPSFETKIIFYLRLINSDKISQIFQNVLVANKNLEKVWKQFMTNIEFQSSIIQIANSRTWQMIHSLQYQMQQIQKIMQQYLQERKKMNSKLRLFSDQTLISMIIQSKTQVVLSNIKKCFNGTKSVKIIEEQSTVAASKKQQVEILNNLNQKIIVFIEQQSKSVVNSNITSHKVISNQNMVANQEMKNNVTYQFDQLLLLIDKQLKKQIKSQFLKSLRQLEFNQKQKDAQNLNNLLCQVQLLRSRLIFKNKIQRYLLNKQNIDVYQLQIIADQREFIRLIRAPLDNCKAKIYSFHIIQYINQLSLLDKLNRNQDPLSSFDWYKYPKYELIQQNSASGSSNKNININSKLKLMVGSYSRQYQFQLVECLKYIVDPLSDSVFLNLCTTISDRMLNIIQGAQGSSKVSTLQYFGQLMGRNITQVNCSSIISAHSLVQYLKIAASGLFLVLNQLQTILKQNLSIFSQTLSTFWITYQTSRTNIVTFTTKQQEILLDVPNFTLFCLCTSIKPLQSYKITCFKQVFRSFSFYPIQFKYLMKCALLSVGLSSSEHSSQIHLCQLLLKQLGYLKSQNRSIAINRNLFIWQIANKFLQLSKKSKIYQIRNQNNEIDFYKDKESCLIVQSLQQILKNYIPENKTQIWNDLQKLGLITKKKGNAFTKIQIQKSELKSQLNELYCQCGQYRKKLSQLQELLNFHNGAIVIGKSMTGKSSLIYHFTNQIINNKRYNFSSINPLAYSMQQLYQGQTLTKGIIRQLVDQIKMRSCALQLNNQVISGFYFNSNMGSWSQPLLSIVNKPDSAKITCSDGSLLTLPNPIKIIFQAQSLQRLSPSNFHSLGIIFLRQHLSWKKAFRSIVEKYFSSNFINSLNYHYISSLFQESFDSASDFYESIFQEKHKKNSKNIVISKLAVLEQVIKFFSVIYHKQDVNLVYKGKQNQTVTQSQKQFQQKVKSQIFNIYTYSVIATLGLLIPDESRKTFARHFKYVLEQTHLSRFSLKKSNYLSKQQQNIYDLYYEKGDWISYKNQPNILNEKIILFDHYKILQRVVSHHTENGSSCFIVGQEYSSRNYFFKSLLSLLKVEKHTKNYFTCSGLTNKYPIANKIAQMIHTQKYSRKINGFSNCKKNIIYIQDINMTLSQSQEQNGSIMQFLKEFYTKRSWFIQNSEYSFGNLQFYGTININLPLPQKILRYMNPIVINNPQNRIQSILEQNIKSSLIGSYERQLVIRCTLNLQEVIKRDFSQIKQALSYFNLRDVIKIVRGVNKIVQNMSIKQQLTKNKLLKYWVYLSDKIYSQKISQEKKGFLFYLINNVLMEEQRVRYRTICPSSDFYILPIIQQNDCIKYSSYSICQLVEKLKQSAQKTEDEQNSNNSIPNSYLNLFVDQNCQQIVKLMVKFANSFDFQSKILIIFNEQRKRIRSILKMVSLVFGCNSLNKNNFIFQTQTYTIHQGIKVQDQKRLQLRFNLQFTKAYKANFGNLEKIIETKQKNLSPFQSQLQSRSILQSQIEQRSLKNSKQRNRVLLHINNRQELISNEKTQNTYSNFILQDLISYSKLNKYPRWLVPKQDLYQQIIQNTQRSIVDRKSASIFKYICKDSNQLIRQQQQIDLIVKSIDMNIILQYYKVPEYLKKYYKSLIDQSSILFLSNPEALVQSAKIDKTCKIIMTDVKQYDEDKYMDDQIEQNICFQIKQGKKIGSAKTLSKIIEKYGTKVYIDFIFGIFRQYLDQKWFCSVPNRDLAFKHSFRVIFNRFQAIKTFRKLNSQKMNLHISKIAQCIKSLKNRLLEQKRSHEFIQQQLKIKELQIDRSLQANQEKYTTEKRKLQQLHQKLEKKQKQYEENISLYRQAMDKYSFQFGRNRDKLVKILANFETGKYNFNTIQNSQNKIMLEIFCCLLFIVDVKKSEQIGSVALRQFTKLLKQKKITKILQKVNIQSLSISNSATNNTQNQQKHIIKLQKIINQYQHIVHKTIEVVSSTSKKIPQTVAINQKQKDKDKDDQNCLFKCSMYEFLVTCLNAAKQFNKDKVSEWYESIQSNSKAIEKVRSEFVKKQKNKGLKQLFAQYQENKRAKDLTCRQLQRTRNFNQQVTLTLGKLEEILQCYVPYLRSQCQREQWENKDKQNKTFIMALCVRYFNQLYYLDKNHLKTVFDFIYSILKQFDPESTETTADTIGKMIEIDDYTVINSVYHYKGVVLVQTKTNEYSINQHKNSVTKQLLYKNRETNKPRKIKDISWSEFIEYDKKLIQAKKKGKFYKSNQKQWIGYEAIIIRIQLTGEDESTNRQDKDSLDKIYVQIVEKVLNIVEDGYLGEKMSNMSFPIFIQSPYFTSEQTNNYPYINLLSVPYKENNHIALQSQIDLNIRKVSGARLSYQYIYQKSKEYLFGDNIYNKYSIKNFTSTRHIGEDEETKEKQTQTKKLILKESKKQKNNILAKFLELQSEQILCQTNNMEKPLITQQKQNWSIKLQKIMAYCNNFQNLFHNIQLQNGSKSARQEGCKSNLKKVTMMDNLKSNSQQFIMDQFQISNKTIQDDDVGEANRVLSDKQRQKLYLEHRICQFFTKYYLILQSMAANNLIERISLNYYLQIALKVIKQCHFQQCTNSAQSPASTNNSSSANATIISNPQATSYRYIHKLKREIFIPLLYDQQHRNTSQLVLHVYNSMIIELCSARVNVFGGQNQYMRYVQLLCRTISVKINENKEEQIQNSLQDQINTNIGNRRIYPNLKKLQPFELQSSKSIAQNNVMLADQKRKNQLQKMFQCIRLFSTNVPKFETFCNEIINQFQFWEEDVDNMYKEDKQIPVQWYFLLLNYSMNKFQKTMNRLQSKLNSKYLQNSLQYIPIQAKLISIFSQTQKPSHMTDNRVIIPVFLHTQHQYSQLVSLVSSQKAQLQFIDIARLIKNSSSCSSKTGSQSKSFASTPANSEKNNAMIAINQLQEFIDSAFSKIYVAYVDTVHDLRLLESLNKIIQTRLQNRKAKSVQDQPINIKILLLTNRIWYTQNTSCLTSLNSFKQNYRLQQQSLVFIYDLLDKYYSNAQKLNLKDKVKCKQYEQLPAKIKKLIFSTLLVITQSAIRITYNKYRQVNSYKQGIIYGLAQRCLLQMERLVKNLKLNKSVNSSNANLADVNTAINEIQTIWRCSITQILQQSTHHELWRQTVNSIFLYAQNQSNKILQDNNNNSNNVISNQVGHNILNKILGVIHECQSFKKLKKVILQQQICQSTKIFKTNFTGDSSRNIILLYNQICKHMKNQDQMNISSKKDFNISFNQLLYAVNRRSTLEKHQQIKNGMVCLKLILRQQLAKLPKIQETVGLKGCKLILSYQGRLINLENLTISQVEEPILIIVANMNERQNLLMKKGILYVNSPQIQFMEVRLSLRFYQKLEQISVKSNSQAPFLFSFNF